MTQDSSRSTAGIVSASLHRLLWHVFLLAGHSNRSGFQAALCCWNQMKFRMFGLANYTFQTEHVSLCRRMFTFLGSNDIPRDTYVIGPHVCINSFKERHPANKTIHKDIYISGLPSFLFTKSATFITSHLLSIYFQIYFLSAGLIIITKSLNNFELSLITSPTLPIPSQKCNCKPATLPSPSSS